MTNTWIISDTHFGHKNIITYENRPFSTVEEMDENMIEYWNNDVNKHDTVFHLGDFAFASKTRIEELVKRLNGDITLILGNHDRFINKDPEYWLKLGFTEVSRYPIIYKDFWIFSHEPMYMNSNMPYANVHGHLHNNVLKGGNYFNACVEHLQYSPVLFSTVTERIKG